MKLKSLVGAGDRIVCLALPPILGGLAANALWPEVFRLGFGAAGWAIGILLLALGIPIWLWAAVQILAFAPRGRLITNGPFAWMLHPIYTSVALLVLPGAGLLADSWLGFASGLVLYLSSRLFAPREERQLQEAFPTEYPAYRSRVRLPWL